MDPIIPAVVPVVEPVVVPPVTPVVEPVVVPPVVPAAVVPPVVPAVVPPVVAPVVPASYDLKLADGSVLDATDVAAFAELAKGKGWTQEQAQAALTDRATELDAQSARFLETLTAHPEIGGAKLAGAQAAANAVLDRFLPASTPEGAELRAGFQKSGFGNWTPIVLLLASVGRAMGEDKPLPLTPGAGGRRSAADVLFGDAKA